MDEDPISLASDNVSPDDIDQLIAWLGSYPRLTQGPLVEQFERSWASRLGVRHAIYVHSGSSANLLMYYALIRSGRLPNSRIIIPSVAWATTVAPAVQFALQPIACDVEWDTFGMDPLLLRDACERWKPGAVMIVHALGVPCNVAEIRRLQSQYGFILLEDACAAFGTTTPHGPVGTFGDMSSFSLFYSHQVTTVEGGFICTSDDEFAELLLQLRAHGWARDLPAATESSLARRWEVGQANRPFAFYQPGFNVRGTEIGARLGLAQLARADHMLQRRIENHRRYIERFAHDERVRWQRAAVSGDGGIPSLGFGAVAPSTDARDAIADAMQRQNIEIRPLSGGNIFRQPFMIDEVGRPPELPVADAIHDCGIQLPNHPSLKTSDVDRIVEVVSNALNTAAVA